MSLNQYSVHCGCWLNATSHGALCVQQMPEHTINSVNLTLKVAQGEVIVLIRDFNLFNFHAQWRILHEKLTLQTYSTIIQYIRLKEVIDLTKDNYIHEFKTTIYEKYVIDSTKHKSRILSRPSGGRRKNGQTKL